jgi:ribonuclease P protein component
MFTARWMCGAPRNLAVPPKHPALYMGTFASAKLDPSAVRRNRMRRRCREAFRLLVQSAPETGPVQLLISPRSASLDAPFPALQDEAKRLLAVLATACPLHAKPPGSSSSR